MLETGYALPLINGFDQKFSCVLPIDNTNVKLTIRLRYNHMAEYWFMTIYDTRTNALLLDSIPLFAGIGASSDILFQYMYLNIGSAFVEKLGIENIEIERPNAEDIPDNYRLVWSDTI